MVSPRQRPSSLSRGVGIPQEAWGHPAHTQRKETVRTICTEFPNGYSGTEVAAPKHPLSRHTRRREAGPGAEHPQGGASEGRDLAVYKE